MSVFILFRQLDMLGISLLFLLIRSIVFVYTIVTLPIYFVLQRPWRKWKNSNVIWAELTNKDDPWSPYRNTSEIKDYFSNMTTLDDMFRFSVRNQGEKKLLGTREVFAIEETPQKDGKVIKKLVLGDYKWISVNEADKMITNVARGLRKLDLNPREKLLILAETRLEWFVTAQACFRTNIIVATLYTNLGEDGIALGINETQSHHIIVSREILPKLKKIMSRIPVIKHIIYMEDLVTPDLSGFPDNVNIMSFSQLQSLGENYDIKFESPSPEDIAVLMYTSGSTGAPKGVLIPHKCFLSSMNGFMNVYNCLFQEGNEYLAYLPLAHMYELLAECVCIYQKAAIGYSSPLTITDKSTGLKTGCKGDISLIRPRLMATVPLVLDRMRKSINETVESKGKLSKYFFKFAMNYKHFWINKGFQTPILDRLIFNDISQLVGGKLEYLSSGGAPLSSDTHQFIETCLGVRILQGYGLTETTGCATSSCIEDYTKSRVGSPLPTALIRLTDWNEGGYHPTDKPYPRGEIVVGGDAVALGYYKNEELTEECFKEENGVRWFYTGDIAEVHPDGCFKIIDRKKDLLKLQYGEYISLGKVESELKTCPLVDNACVFGTSFMTYVVALVVPNQFQLKCLAKQLNKDHLNFKELCHDQEITKEATKIIKEHARECRLMKTEIPQKIKLCSEEWLPETGLVTAAFKIRRKVIEQYYQQALNRMTGLEGNGNSKST